MKVRLSFENRKLYVMKYDRCVNVNAFVKATGFSALVFSGPVMCFLSGGSALLS